MSISTTSWEEQFCLTWKMLNILHYVKVLIIKVQLQQRELFLCGYIELSIPIFLLQSSWPSITGVISNRKQRLWLKECYNLLLTTGYPLYPRSQEIQFNSESTAFIKSYESKSYTVFSRMLPVGSLFYFHDKQKESLVSDGGSFLPLSVLQV